MVWLLLVTACADDPPRVGSPCPALVMAEVNDHWIEEHPDPGDNQWARAAYFTGNMAAYEVLGDEAYLDYAGDWAGRNGWGLNRDVETRIADDHCAGQTYLALYEYAPDPIKIADITESVDLMVAGEARDDWSWIDALYMASPVFAQLGKVHRDPAYSDAMFEFYLDTRDGRGLYDPEAGLWFRDESYLFPEVTTPNGEKVFWSRGNGWVMGSLVRTLEHLPYRSPYRDEYVAMLQTMAAALAEVQRDDGFWNVSLLDPDDFGGRETSGTAFFAYGIAWGIDHGHLDRDTYLPVVEGAWLGLVEEAVHEGGRLGYVQDVGEAPDSSQPVTYDSSADFGVGAFLLAGSQVHALGIDLDCDP